MVKYFTSEAVPGTIWKHVGGEVGSSTVGEFKVRVAASLRVWTCDQYDDGNLYGVEDGDPEWEETVNLRKERL